MATQENKPEPATLEDLDNWYVLNQQLAALKAHEMQLRIKLFKSHFPEPVEGSKNKSPLEQGYTLKATHNINRSIDQAALDGNRALLTKHNINIDECVKWKPELINAGYKALTVEQIALFDSVLKISDGSPKLEIIAPKIKPT